MSFQQTGSWREAKQSIVPPAVQDLPAFGATSRRWVAGAVTIAIHACLGFLFVSKLVQVEPPAKVEREAPPSVFDLSPLHDSPAPKAVATARVSPTVPADPVELDVTTPAVPVEWTTVKVRVEAAPSVAATPLPAAPADSAGGAGAGGEGDYDPYAGAAPRRRSGAEELARAGIVLPGWVDPGAYAQLRRDVLRAVPGARGTVDLMVRLDGSGRVIDARVVGGSGSHDVRRAAHELVARRRLGLGVEAGERELRLELG